MRTDQLMLWLAESGAGFKTLDALFVGFCDHLQREGAGLSRAALGIEFLHPEISGQMLVWTDHAPVQHSETVRDGLAENPAYFLSPTRVVDETGVPFRRRLDGPVPDMPLLEELRCAGMTDYYMVPLPFLDRTRTAVLSFATRRPGGFTSADLDRLQTLAAGASPWIERFVWQRLTADLLETYVGARSGARIISGTIERGSVETITAAIWFADLRGFTALTESRPVAEVIEALGRWFELTVTAISGHDGEVLKFIGDAVLAIFPATPARSIERACADAIQAASDLGSAVDRMDAGRRFDFALGLHAGDVAFGNVGAPRRLDFTVVGPAVNRAARLQDLAKKLGRRVVLSEALALRVEAPLIPLGAHTLRGIAGAEPVYGL
ncbi:adenylate/guanylate cyclase domain-containing protein [Prosthecomicrobium sp. N25]|uniref:adenylate/guanylate cyclase domain-containing protein n=1 Tax=Prosthecomicrobium sp. N25 TaxID=3129254 RepID=UPI003076D628